MTNDSFDYVIVGGGSAGCVLANRLSEDKSVSVALIEAGGEHNRLFINMPMGCGKTIYMPTFSWQFHSEPEPGSNQRRYYHPRGHLLGGSSSINGLIYIRGQHQDYDDWSAAGANGWDWDSVKPYFLKAEDQARGANEWHGVGGPLSVEDPCESYPIDEDLINAGVNAGLRRNDDFNGASQEGIGRYQATTRAGQRCSAANAYLDPARSRDNLTVLVGALAERVLVEDRRASGVMVRQRGTLRQLDARREVILAAGAFQSPQLLQLSGIGPGALLQQHGIDVVVDSPGVGMNLHDHVGPPMAWQLKDPNASLNRKLRLPTLLVEVMRYFLAKRGVMTLPSASTGIFTDSSAMGGRPDLQFHCLAVTGDVEAEIDRGEMVLDNFPGLTIMPYPTRPRSRGNVKITSPDPAQLPSILMNYLSDPYDVDVLLKGMRLAQKIAGTEPLAAHIEARVRPGPDDESDEAFVRYARHYSHTGYHPVGSCRMGSDAVSVVDCDLKVRGVDALRVVDCSVMPSVTSGNTNAAAIMIAEKIADTIH